MSIRIKKESTHIQVEVEEVDPSGSSPQEEQAKAKLTTAPEVMSAKESFKASKKLFKDTFNGGGENKKEIDKLRGIL